MAIDQNIQDNGQTIYFGADDSGVNIFTSGSDEDGLFVYSPEAARDLARWLLAWAGPADQPAPTETAPQGAPACSRDHGYVPPGMVCARCGQERCADCHMIGRHHAKCTRGVVK